MEVYALRVEEVADLWPEQERQRRWVRAAEAAEAVNEPELRALLRRLPALVAALPGEGEGT